MSHDPYDPYDPYEYNLWEPEKRKRKKKRNVSAGFLDIITEFYREAAQNPTSLIAISVSTFATLFVFISNMFNVISAALSLRINPFLAILAIPFFSILVPMIILMIAWVEGRHTLKEIEKDNVVRSITLLSSVMLLQFISSIIVTVAGGWNVGNMVTWILICTLAPAAFYGGIRLTGQFMKS